MFTFHEVPPVFSTDAFRLSLSTKWLAREVCALCSVDSTNTYALRLADEDARHGLVIVAEEQTAGRGRFQRLWEAPAGKALLASIILRGESFLRHENSLTMAASVAVHRLLSDLEVHDVTIRWPNDILIRGRKVCGVLLERGPWHTPGWVLGIGLNLLQRQDEFRESLRSVATSLLVETEISYTREMLLSGLSGHLENVFEAIQTEHGAESIRQQWEAASCVIGSSIDIDTGVETISGMVVGIEPNGALILRQPNGFLKTVHSGTVLRPKG